MVVNLEKTTSGMIASGIKGLDEMIGGGIPKGKVILLCGGPGTGKTIFCLQVLASAAENNTKGVYMSLEEPISQIKSDTQQFPWKISEKEKTNLIRLIEARAAPSFKDERKTANEGVRPESISEKIVDTAKSIDAKLVLIDPLTSLTVSEQSAGNKRRLVAEFFESLKRSGLTCIVTCEGNFSDGEFYMEEFLADGVIKLNKAIEEFNLIRTIRVEKMRGRPIDEQPRRYEINAGGLKVYNTEKMTVERSLHE